MISEKMKQKLIGFVKEDVSGKDVTTSLITGKNCYAVIKLKEKAENILKRIKENKHKIKPIEKIEFK